ncbi:MAG: hypothetical protein D8M59_14855 [Planctomycetes bacterium]|nr:hypothetical protein [Planctomycetota bacterium]NOG55029.1 hypothetical protein [Planctomycetota bacterium]
MTTSTRQRNNTIAGIFVLASIVGFVLVTYLLSNIGGLMGSNEYVAHFPLNLGVPGLQKGSDVTVGGIRGGSVLDVGLGPVLVESKVPGQMVEEERVLATFRLEKRFELRTGARVGLVLPLIGSGTTLNIDNLGTGQPMAAGDMLAGDIAESLLLKSAGIDVEQVSVIMGNVEDISADLKELAGRFNSLVEQNGDALVQSAKSSLERVREMIAEIQQYWPQWMTRVDRIAVNIEQASDKVPGVVDDADRVLVDADLAINEAREALALARPGALETIDNLKETTAHFNSVTIGEVDSAIAQGKSAMERANTVIGHIDEGLIARLPEVSRILGNMRIASNFLKLAMIEIRSQPWKLIYDPSRNEVAESELHESVRTYAAAVSDLNATVIAIEALQARQGASTDPDSPDMKLLLEELQQRFSTYKEKEQGMFEKLLNQSSGTN